LVSLESAIIGSALGGVKKRLPPNGGVSTIDGTVSELLTPEGREVWDAALSRAAAVDRRDLEAVLAHYFQGPEATAVLPGAAEPRRGWSEVKPSLERGIEEFQQSRTRISEPRVIVMGDWALLTYRLQSDSRVHDIDFNWVGWISEVFVMRHGRWLVLHHHASEAYRPDSL